MATNNENGTSVTQNRGKDINVISLVQIVEKEMDKIKNEPLKDAVTNLSEKKFKTVVTGSAKIKGDFSEYISIPLEGKYAEREDEHEI